MWVKEEVGRETGGRGKRGDCDQDVMYMRRI